MLDKRDILMFNIQVKIYQLKFTILPVFLTF